MARTSEEVREYQRGYNRGYSTARKSNWPDECPAPPDKLVAAVFEAARELGNAVDAQMAMFDEGDEVAEYLYGYRDKLIEAMQAVRDFAQDGLRQD